MAPREENPTLAFASPKAWETWLARNYAKSPGIWLRIYKKGSGQRSITYAKFDSHFLRANSWCFF